MVQVCVVSDTVCSHTYPSVQSCAAPLVLSIWQGTLLQQEVDTVGVTSLNREHQRSPVDSREDVFFLFTH